MTNTTKTTVTDSNLTAPAEWMEVFTDSSGAPAMLRVEGFFFACDFLGTMSVRCISAGSTRKPSKRAIRIAKWRYTKLIEKHTSPEWRDAGRELYEIADEPAHSSVNDGDDHDDEMADRAIAAAK